MWWCVAGVGEAPRLPTVCGGRAVVGAGVSREHAAGPRCALSLCLATHTTSLTPGPHTFHITAVFIAAATAAVSCYFRC